MSGLSDRRRSSRFGVSRSSREATCSAKAGASRPRPSPRSTASSSSARRIDHRAAPTFFGALEPASQFFEAYPDADGRTLVIVSDMMRSANGMHLGAVEDWSPSTVDEPLREAPAVGLDGVRVYVVGAGATSLAEITPDEIKGIETFWRAWFEAAVVFSGANVARFPIEDG
jgi:hypothetical protein